MTQKKAATGTDEGADDEGALFRRAVADAVPLQRDFVEAVRQRPAPRARFARRAERPLAESLTADRDEAESAAGERLQFQRPGIGPRTLRRLARGRYSVQRELDLHGMTVAEAEAALRRFIEDSLNAGCRCVRIVHGKGLGSGSAGPRLKPKVYSLLRRWRAVLAFTSARQVDGGSGAVYVLLADPGTGSASGTT
jgi:DNA-nicking Smr family endonuclease